MKKFLFGALALLTAVSVMTSCEQNTEKPKAEELTLSKTSVKMAITVYDSEKGEVANTDRFTITPKELTRFPHLLTTSLRGKLRRMWLPLLQRISVRPN